MLNVCEGGHAVVSLVQPQENLALPSRDFGSQLENEDTAEMEP